MLGPVDYIVVGFEGNNFDGSVLMALTKATDQGIIRVLDLVLIVKDDKGIASIAEIEDQEGDLKEMAKRLGYRGDLPLITEDDIQKLSKKMTNDTSAGILVIEQLWAKELKSALIDAGGELLDEGRIHPDIVTLAIEELEEVAENEE